MLPHGNGREVGRRLVLDVLVRPPVFLENFGGDLSRSTFSAGTDDFVQLVLGTLQGQATGVLHSVVDGLRFGSGGRDDLCDNGEGGNLGAAWWLAGGGFTG